MYSLEVGGVYAARNQGPAITGQATQVTVVWIENDHVHYRLTGQSAIKQTPISRFLEIIGKS